MKRLASQSMLNQAQLQLRPNISKKYIKNQQQELRSLYIVNFTIYVFTDCKNFSNLNIELTNIAETITRPAHINQFQVNKSSLQQAKSLGYTYEKLSHFFQKHMKNPPISQVLDKLLRQVLNNDFSCRIYLQETKEKNFYIFQVSKKFAIPQNVRHLLGQKLPDNLNIQNEQQLQEINVNSMKNKLQNWQVAPYEHNQLSKRLFDQQIPILSEKAIDLGQIHQDMHRNVDLFRNKGVLHCKNLKIELKAFTKLRDYQIQALRAVVHIPLRKQKKSKIIAKSGYIVLPCGAGKTLLGISICCKIKKQTLIVCSSDSGVDQWKKQIQKWTQGFSKQQIVTLTAKTIEEYKFSVSQKKAHIYITTYSNLKSKFQPRTTQHHQQGRKQVKVQHQWLKNMPWGLVIFDEAQWLPAPGNSEIVKSLLAHVKIGLTATPLRQDQQIKSLIYMIGPQLYVGSWRKFVEMGFLANPKCIEIRTKLPKVLQRQYDSKTNDNERVGYYECNPYKIKTLMYLLHHHQKLNDQIIVFCDRISIIEFLAQKLKIPLLSGKTSIQDRNFVFDMFREGVYKTVLLSRIGDEAIDLPNANVAIEINIHKGSRRQMLQRLGRIMRPKEASSSQSYNAIFYTIVTDKTVQMKHFSKRRQCLVNLGFQYDLRFCEYGQKNILDILVDDRQLYQEVNDRYNQIIDDEIKFYQSVRTKIVQEDE